MNEYLHFLFYFEATKNNIITNAKQHALDTKIEHRKYIFFIT